MKKWIVPIVSAAFLIGAAGLTQMVAQAQQAAAARVFIPGGQPVNEEQVRAKLQSEGWSGVVFTRDGQLVDCWGQAGTEPGQLSYPYDLAFGHHNELYVVERGNNRVQKFTTKGQSLGVWGGPGREPGQLWEPWALVVDSRGKVHVIDTQNHRVQRIDF